jgi:hypothetical protein
VGSYPSPSEIGRCLRLKPEDKGYFVLQKDGAFTLRFDPPRQQELVENLLRRNYTVADLRELRDALLFNLAAINRVLEAIDENRAYAA